MLVVDVRAVRMLVLHLLVMMGMAMRTRDGRIMHVLMMSVVV
jgi:hypothetical protein